MRAHLRQRGPRDQAMHRGSRGAGQHPRHGIRRPGSFQAMRAAPQRRRFAAMRRGFGPMQARQGFGRMRQFPGRGGGPPWAAGRGFPRSGQGGPGFAGRLGLGRGGNGPDLRPWAREGAPFRGGPPARSWSRR
jgi:hypothetical protein